MGVASCGIFHGIFQDIVSETKAKITEMYLEIASIMIFAHHFEFETFFFV